MSETLLTREGDRAKVTWVGLGLRWRRADVAGCVLVMREAVHRYASQRADLSRLSCALED